MSARTGQTQMLSCKGLWKIYGRAPPVFADPGAKADALRAAASDIPVALADIDLDIRKGEVFVLMGLSGSGKSTLLRCLARLVEPTSGRIEVAGDDLLAMDRATLRDLRRRRMSMVFQNFALLPHRTVLGNVEMPLELQGVPPAERHRKALEMIELVGLTERRDYYPRELSGGQQQRVGIARSLTTNPDIWFLDEPFSALDPLTRREMQGELLRLQEAFGKTIVFVTHDAAEAIRVGDRIALMRDGRIVQCGKPVDLVFDPADAYVRSFMQDVERTALLTVAATMEPMPAASEKLGTIGAHASLLEAARRIAGHSGHLEVLDDGGTVLGHVSDRSLGRALLAAAGESSRP